jgi:hypothetical protein
MGGATFPQNPGHNPTEAIGALTYWSVLRPFPRRALTAREEAAAAADVKDYPDGARKPESRRTAWWGWQDCVVSGHETAASDAGATMRSERRFAPRHGGQIMVRRQEGCGQVASGSTAAAETSCALIRAAPERLRQSSMTRRRDSRRSVSPDIERFEAGQTVRLASDAARTAAAPRSRRTGSPHD